MTINAAVFIGRFQPFHNGHLHTLETALSKYDKVAVVLGSHNSLRSTKNPWTVQERETMIRGAVSNHLGKLHFHWQEDRPNQNGRWASEIRQGVGGQLWDFTRDVKIHLTGYHKDESSFYLSLFPEWEFRPEAISLDINATDIRRQYFEGRLASSWAKHLPPSSYNLLQGFRETNLFLELMRSSS